MVLGIICLTSFGLNNFMVRWTDVDSAFSATMPFSSSLDKTSLYKTSCAKPNGFKGFYKYRVSCLEYQEEQQDFAASFSRLRTFGWETGKMSIEDTQIIVTMERPQSEYPNCKRQIYVIIPNDIGPDKGDKIYFADPRHLYCSSPTNPSSELGVLPRG